MLQQWLGDTSVEAFVSEHLHAAPHASPGAARGAMSAFDWAALERVLTAAPPPDALVVARGQLIPMPPPRELIEVRGLMRSGIGLVVRRAERNDAGLAALAASFARDLPGEVHLQLFVTPGGTHGFGWHYDFEDVFIVQTHGAKEYFLRPNTVDPDTPLGQQPDFERYRDETSPVYTASLIAGDWLYVPARWWHMARCIEDSLSISVGVLPGAARADQ